MARSQDSVSHTKHPTANDHQADSEFSESSWLLPEIREGIFKDRHSTPSVVSKGSPLRVDRRVPMGLRYPQIKTYVTPPSWPSWISTSHSACILMLPMKGWVPCWPRSRMKEKGWCALPVGPSCSSRRTTASQRKSTWPLSGPSKTSDTI